MTNLIDNGDFATGDLTNWTASPPGSWSVVSNATHPPPSSNAANTGNVAENLLTYSATINTTPGNIYELQFWHMGQVAPGFNYDLTVTYGPTDNTSSEHFGSTTDFGWTLVNNLPTFMADSSATVLQFDVDISVVTSVAAFITNISITDVTVCLATDTQILMSDNTLKSIQNIKINDEVAGDPKMKNKYKVSRLTHTTYYGN